jgi:hypothetical protein
MNDRPSWARIDRESASDILAMFYRQLCADETAVSYLYTVIARRERSPERRVLFQQMSARAADAAGRYAQRSGTRAAFPSISTRFWLWFVTAFGYSAAFKWVERIETRETRLKTTLLRILWQGRTKNTSSTKNAAAFNRRQ